MLTSGLVVILEPDASNADSALAAIRSNPVFTIGEQNGCWLSVASEADDPDESEQWHDWLSRLPGVVNVEVVFVHSDDTEAAHEHG
jgi:nitrate reductase NapAB chaperone NapD